MHSRRLAASSALVAISLIMAACGSASETLVVTERPEPVDRPPADTSVVAASPIRATGLDTVDLGADPSGRMWTPDQLPTAYFESHYGFSPDSAWINEIRRATLRLPNCTAAFVSGDGLIVTNYHCIRSELAELESPVDTSLFDGFDADSIGGALRIDELYADQLIAIEDVTQRIRSRIDHLSDDDRRGEVLRTTVDNLEDRLTAEAKLRDTTRHVEVVALHSGARFSAYTYRRIHDLRLVFVPDKEVGTFGGDTHNFSYPRFTLDVAFLRAFDESGVPWEAESYYAWSDTGVEEGDAVFTAGNPGTTYRFRTVSQLEYERDLELPAELAVLGARAAALEQFLTQHPVLADSFDVESTLTSIRNVQKEGRGRLAALNDPAFLRQVAARMEQTATALADRDSLLRVFRNAVRSIDATQRTKRASASQVAPFALFGSEVVDSHILLRGIYAFLYDFTTQRGAPPDFVAEYRSSGREVEPLPLELEEALLAARLRELEEHLGAGDPSLRTILRGRTPRDAAGEIVRGTALVDSVGFDSLLDAGFLSSGDPSVALAESIVPLYLAVAEQQSSIESREDRLLSQLAEARLAISERLAPDATFSLRISDGRVSGYPYNGTLAPPYTTFYGMYNAHHSYTAGPDFMLPDAWKAPTSAFELQTPLNFVATIDLTGGSSGSPVFTQELSLVGVAFDSNTQALPNAYLFSEQAGRGIIVDVRGVTEALRDMYGASSLLDELQRGAIPSAD